MSQQCKDGVRCEYCWCDKQPQHTIATCLERPRCCVCAGAHKGKACTHMPASVAAAHQALVREHKRRGRANLALHVELAKQRQRHTLEAESAECGSVKDGCLHRAGRHRLRCSMWLHASAHIVHYAQAMVLQRMLMRVPCRYVHAGMLRVQRRLLCRVRADGSAAREAAQRHADKTAQLLM